MAVKGKTHEPGRSPLMPQDGAEPEFEAPNTVPGSNADYELNQQRTDEPESEETQESLALEGSKASEPAVVQNNKMLCQFVRPHFEMDTDGERFVGFEFSLPLFPIHEEKSMVPSEVLEEWIHMRKGNVKRTEVKAVQQQTLAVGVVPDDPDGDFFLTAATISHAVLQVVETKGSGKTNSTIRFSFRATVDQTENAARFAVDNHGVAVWINMQRTHASLFENQAQAASA